MPSTGVSRPSGVTGTENGVLIFKILRNALDAPDRVIYDEVGLYDYARVDKKKVEIDEVVGL